MKKLIVTGLLIFGLLMIGGEPGEGTPFWLLLFCGLMLVIGALFMEHLREGRFFR